MAQQSAVYGRWVHGLKPYKGLHAFGWRLQLYQQLLHCSGMTIQGGKREGGGAMGFRWRGGGGGRRVQLCTRLLTVAA